MTRKTMLVLVLLAAICASAFAVAILPSMIYYFLFTDTSRPFQNIEKYQWVSVEVSYCVGDGPEVTKNTQVITDTDVLEKLRSLFAVRSWEFRTLHTASKWNKVIITLDNGDVDALVLIPNEALYYAVNRKAVGIVLGGSFEHYLCEVLQENEDEKVYFYYGYPKGADIVIKNQERMLIPDNNKWRLEAFPGAEQGKKYH